MKASAVCFTEQGLETEKIIAEALISNGYEAESFVSGKHAIGAALEDELFEFTVIGENGLKAWTGEQWEKSDVIVFVGALGIAVREIAHFIEDKKTDPAVICVDEKAKFVIPVLSGHAGGANETALLLAEELSAYPVITTATDINGKFAVDVFAKKRGLIIDDWSLARDISADILAGDPVGLYSDFPIDGRVPEELSAGKLCRRNILITAGKRDFKGALNGRVLKLIPGCVTVGIGCRLGTDKETIRRILREAFGLNKIDERSICRIASIDRKKDEAGIKELAKEMKVPFVTFSSEELSNIPGDFSESEFVEETVGVGNVCERAAMAATDQSSKNPRILFGKFARDGVTVAAAITDPVLFGKEE